MQNTISFNFNLLLIKRCKARPGLQSISQPISLFIFPVFVCDVRTLYECHIWVTEHDCYCSVQFNNSASASAAAALAPLSLSPAFLFITQGILVPETE